MAKKKQPVDSLQLKITLRGSKPPIWRRVIVPANCPLETFHAVIQMAMGWTNSHLHSFMFQDREFGGRDPMGGKVSDPFWDFGSADAADYCLSDLIRGPKEKFSYQYDFGDSWDHVILVEKILPAGSVAGKPFQCI